MRWYKNNYSRSRPADNSVYGVLIPVVNASYVRLIGYLLKPGTDEEAACNLRTAGLY